MSTTSVRLACALAVASFAFACGGGEAAQGPAAAPTAAPADAGATAPAVDDAAKKAADLEALTADEAKKGECSPEHKEALEKLLASVETGLKAKTTDDGKPLNPQIVSKRTLALGSSGKGMELSLTGKGTELHVIAWGVKDISLDALQGTTAATTMRSPYAKDPGAKLEIDLPKIGKVTELQSDSRQMVIKAGQPVQVKLTGQGCAGLISFLRP